MKIIVLMTLLFGVSSFSQSINSLIPNKYEIMDSLKVDYNNDDISDYILALSSPLEDSIPEQYPRILLILRGKDSLNFSLEVKNDTLLLCKDCGGFFDPYSHMEFRDDTLIVNHYGGSIWRWEENYYYAYNRENYKWLLVKLFTCSYNNLDPDSTYTEETKYYK